ncbi:MAG: hypothetical protein K1X67_14040 [Fimbriimonadaceae bacterium]|nr:hypothetical protein [Fimbriimonadaceae bacterium]
MRMSGHEINSQLRQKLEMPTGRHLYVVLGTYVRLEHYERVDFREARSPTNQKLDEIVNVNHQLLERIPDDELKKLVQTEASRTESVKARLIKELDALVGERLNAGSFLALKNLEMIFAYDLELNCLRIRAANQKHILVLLPGEKVGDRITLFHEAPSNNHRTLPTNLVPENHLWELSE